MNHFERHSKGQSLKDLSSIYTLSQTNLPKNSSLPSLQGIDSDKILGKKSNRNLQIIDEYQLDNFPPIERSKMFENIRQINLFDAPFNSQSSIVKSQRRKVNRNQQDKIDILKKEKDLKQKQLMLNYNVEVNDNFDKEISDMELRTILE